METQATISVNSGRLCALSEPMNGIGDRIKQLRASRNWRQEDLAAQLGLTRGAIANWERGKGIKTDNISTLSRIFGVSFQWIAQGGDEIAPSEAPTPEAQNRFTSIDNTNRLPVFGKPVGGPVGEFVMDQFIGEIVCPVWCEDPSKLYAARVCGDTMAPKYEDGDIVICDPNAVCRTGDYVLAKIKNEEGEPTAYIKRLVRYTTEELVLAQFNPKREIRFDGSDVESVDAALWSGVWR